MSHRDCFPEGKFSIRPRKDQVVNLPFKKETKDKLKTDDHFLADTIRHLAAEHSRRTMPWDAIPCSAGSKGFGTLIKTAFLPRI